MKVAVDTSVLVRAVVRDDPAQASAAVKVLTDAGLIAVATPCLCEFFWGENWGQSKITIMRIPKTVFQAVQRESGLMYLMGLLGVRFNAVHLTTHMQSNRRFIASPLFSTETS